MKKMRHISPTQSANTICMINVFLALALSRIMLTVTKGVGTFFIISLISCVLAIIFWVIQVVFSTKLRRNKNLKVGDEYTTKSMNKSAYYCFFVMLILIFSFFIVIQFISVVKENALVLNDIISAELITIIFFLIVISCSTLYILLMNYFLKKGESNDE